MHQSIWLQFDSNPFEKRKHAFESLFQYQMHFASLDPKLAILIASLLQHHQTDSVFLQNYNFNRSKKIHRSNWTTFQVLWISKKQEIIFWMNFRKNSIMIIVTKFLIWVLIWLVIAQQTKGDSPVSKKYKIAPNENKSHLSSYSPSKMNITQECPTFERSPSVEL